MQTKELVAVAPSPRRALTLFFHLLISFVSPYLLPISPSNTLCPAMMAGRAALGPVYGTEKYATELSRSCRAVRSDRLSRLPRHRQGQDSRSCPIVPHGAPGVCGTQVSQVQRHGARGRASEAGLGTWGWGLGLLRSCVAWFLAANPQMPTRDPLLSADPRQPRIDHKTRTP